MVYGQACQGISGKKSLDTVTATMQIVPPSPLSNPIIASWITGSARTVLGEVMNNVKKLGGRIVSATTDGLITDIDNLENTLLKTDLDNTFLKSFRTQRELLGHADCTALELKTEVEGMNA